MRMSEQEQAVFNELHREYFDKLVYWCLGYINYNPELRNQAEDGAQESFKRAIKDKDKFFRSNNQFAWLITACKHIADNALQRKKVRSKRHGPSLDDPNRPLIEDISAGFERWVKEQEAADTIEKITRLLTNEEHRVYEEYFVEGLSEKAVAEKIGKPVSAIKATIRRIRSKAGQMNEHKSS